MVEIHNTVRKVFEENKEALEIFECKDEFSDTQNFCDYYGFDIEAVSYTHLRAHET